MSNVNSNGCMAARYERAVIEINASTVISNDNESSDGALHPVMGVISIGCISQ